MSPQCRTRTIAPFGGRWVENGGWLQTPRFLDAMRRHFSGKNSFLRDTVEIYDTEKTDDGIRWKDYTAKAIIDCTGIELFHTPASDGMPFNPCKGELLHINAEGLPKNMVIHGSIKIIPTGGNGYFCGATYDYTRRDNECTEEGLEKLESAIKKLTHVPYTITHHCAAVRPSTSDRKPIIGPHFKNERYYYFNGLGSKGYFSCSACTVAREAFAGWSGNTG